MGRSTQPEQATYEPVLVIWADAHAGVGGWLDLAEYDDDGECLVSTVGFLVPETDKGGKRDHLTVWQTIVDGEGINPFHIPTAMVRKTVVLAQVALPSKKVDKDTTPV